MKVNGIKITIYTELFKSVKAQFDKEGIEIPFPHRTIVMKKDKNENNDKASLEN
ncbi:mechanosensitive ion channel family protein [Candidatus Kapabacteria bacterium]|nr:mechanosensitive ion channel family protein [Candidatus Kapabacteria bacterium]